MISYWLFCVDSKRERIYRFLLNHVNDEQKFNLCGKLSHDVLGGVVDDVIPYDVDSAAILQDTFSILCSKVQQPLFVFFFAQNTSGVFARCSRAH